MRIMLALGTVAFTLAAQEPAVEYWPLTPGNQWIYRSSLGEPLTVSVTRQRSLGGRVYAEVTGLLRPALQPLLLRQEGHQLMAFDPAMGAEQLYLDLGGPLNQSRPSLAHPCNSTAAVTSRHAMAALPLGSFEGLIAVRYGGNTCADAGLTEDFFLPYVGLMRRTETTLTGPRSYDLVYSRINGVVMISTPETGFAVHVSPDSRGWLIRMTLRHTAGEPLRLDFASGQIFDIAIKNEKGEVVYRWSADKSFIAALQSIEVSGERNWATLVAGSAIPGSNRAGRFTVDAWLTTLGGQLFRASTLFVVEAGIAQTGVSAPDSGY
jgi:hypothetical protein